MEGLFLRGKRFNTKSKRFNVEFTCCECSKKFGKKSNLKDHLKVHSDYRPYICICCNKLFKQKVQKESHETTYKHKKIFAKMQNKEKRCNQST